MRLRRSCVLDIHLFSCREINSPSDIERNDGDGRDDEIQGGQLQRGLERVLEGLESQLDAALEQDEHQGHCREDASQQGELL